MKITINNREIEFESGETVLTIATKAGIDIPHLCALDWAPSPSASCRMCVVEVEGIPKLMTSCTLEARDGMVVQTHTPRLQKVRRNIMELLLANHPDDCLVCQKHDDCKLSKLSWELGVRQRRYSGSKQSHPIDVSSPSIVRDPNKCILCGRCVAACQHLQGVGAIDFAFRGVKTRVDPAFHEGLNVSGCVFCGQCVRVCPTGALMEKSAVDQVLTALADPNVAVVAQVAPAVPATLLEEVEGTSVTSVLETLASALKSIGFKAVFDTAFTADLTIMEEVSELVDRLTNNKPIPMFTSCSPGWIRYVELYHPELLPNLSSCKSPQQMAGALIKELAPKNVPAVGDKRIYSVSIMPCTAKKYEARELGDVDAVLTTRELKDLFSRFGMDLNRHQGRTELDNPLGEATGAGRIFGGTGGVMEAAIRTAHYLVTGKEIANGPKIKEARGLDYVKIFSFNVGDLTLEFAVVNGLGQVEPLLEQIRSGKLNLHFIEVMTCPGGCVGGGGQPYGTDSDALKDRLRRLYEADRKAPARGSHQNETVQELYRTLLGKPLGEMSHKLLHRKYVDRSNGDA